MNPMYMRWGKLYKGTPAELSLEPALAAIGLAYRTQLPGFLFGFRFFPDVFFPQIGLIIEIDDSSHSKADKMAADEERTAYLATRGWQVVRCTNEEALNDPHGTVKRLLREAGITDEVIARAKRIPLAQCMPRPGRAPQAQSREAKSAATRARRGLPPLAAPAPRKPATPPPTPPKQ